MPLEERRTILNEMPARRAPGYPQRACRSKSAGPSSTKCRPKSAGLSSTSCRSKSARLSSTSCRSKSAGLSSTSCRFEEAPDHPQRNAAEERRAILNELPFEERRAILNELAVRRNAGPCSNRYHWKNAFAALTWTSFRPRPRGGHDAAQVVEQTRVTLGARAIGACCKNPAYAGSPQAGSYASGSHGWSRSA